ncbi:hypothetical protein ABW20_dc0107314 [Dactylellina cionopaga]|nr:hypothetical protein ABW20_dc0107314 [Dactylellina cionopaga]
MALMKMEPDWWLELESTYVTRLAQRKKLYDEHRQRIITVVSEEIDGNGTIALAWRELKEMIIQFLCARYPKYFSLDLQKMVFYNRILDRRFELEEVDSVKFIFENVPEEFAIMSLDEKTGKYVNRGGIICSAIGFDIAGVVGKELGQIHAGVPDYKEKMGMSMDRFFSKMSTNKPIQRGSWDIVPGEPLFVESGPELVRIKSTQNPHLKEEDLTLRVDWQTLRRLPLSNAIVFNYKALFTPLRELEDEPGVPALVEKVLKEGNRSILKYKGTYSVEHVAVPMLEKMRKKQVEKGLWEEGKEVRTLDESPFYKGWEEKWHTQQRF